MPPSNLISMLRQLAASSTTHFAAVLDVVLHWITYYWADFACDASILSDVMGIVDSKDFGE